MDNGDKRRPTGDYAVGYCRPPEHTRFKKGEKRQRKAASNKSAPEEIMGAIIDEKVEIRQNGRRARMGRQTILIKRLLHDAARGDKRSREEVFDCVFFDLARKTAQNARDHDGLPEPAPFD